MCLDATKYVGFLNSCLGLRDSYAVQQPQNLFKKHHLSVILQPTHRLAILGTIVAKPLQQVGPRTSFERLYRLVVAAAETHPATSADGRVLATKQNKRHDDSRHGKKS